jgi:hypothetical protein
MMDTVFVLEQSQVQPKVAAMTAEGRNGASPIETLAPVHFLPALTRPAALYTPVCVESNVFVMITLI